MGSIFSYFISVTQKNDLYSNILSFLAGLFASFFIISVYKNRKEYKFYITILFLFDAFAFSLLLILFNLGLTNNIRSNMLQAMMLKREQKMNQDLENLVRQRTQELLSANKEMGVSSSIDDFGTGYSSLSYIKKFSVDRLKIAKELVDNIENDENTSLIVNTIIKMAKGLNLKTIAEGVEDITQLEIIENLGCDEIQGFIFGKSVPPDTFEMAHILPIKKQVMFSPVSSIL